MSGVSSVGRQLLCLAGNAPRVCAIVLAVQFFAPFIYALPACADEYDIIIEKNIFHDQRQKWEMQNPQSKGAGSPGGSAEGKNIDQINLFGTVVRDSHSYAVMRVTQPTAPRPGPRGRPPKGGEQDSEQTQDTKRPYAVGDFIGGYRLVEIRAESVMLQDPADKARYEIFMNQSETERSAVKTELAEEKPPAQPPEAPAARRPAPNPQQPPEGSPNPAQSADFMRQRFQKDMQNLRQNPNDAALQQAESDWEKLQEMMPSLEESGREDLMRLREEFEKMRQE